MSAAGRRFPRALPAALGVALVAVLAVTRWVAVPWTVVGPSMEPTLFPGDRVVVDLRALRGRAPRVGDVVVVLGPHDLAMVKRVAPPPDPTADPAGSGVENGLVWVVGDNAADSVDSRTFGPVPRERLLGVVRWRYWPPSRAGSIR